MTDTVRPQVSRFHPELPLEKASTLPSRWYREPRYYERECEQVFLNSWQAVGRVDQVAEPGQYFTAEVAGEPVVVSRDGEGRLRAFSNVCRHRAARVACQAEGKAHLFKCRYHGWLYNLDGTLRGTPEFDGVQDFDRSQVALPRWRVDTWGPFVFVHFRSEGESLQEFLSPVAELAPEMDLSGLSFHSRKEYELSCNWKVFVDNFLDGGYHVNTIHPSLSGVIDYRHYTITNRGKLSLQSTPLRPSRDPKISAVRSGEKAYYWWWYPNFMVNVYAGVMDTNLVLPLGPDRCRVVIDFYFGASDSQSAPDFSHESIRVAHGIQQEDIEICEDAYRGLLSRHYDTGRFSVRRESAGYHFHRLLADAVDLS